MRLDPHNLDTVTASDPNFKQANTQYQESKLLAQNNLSKSVSQRNISSLTSEHSEPVRRSQQIAMAPETQLKTEQPT